MEELWGPENLWKTLQLTQLETKLFIGFIQWSSAVLSQGWNKFVLKSMFLQWHNSGSV